jgi:hypothetical protein
MTASRRAEEVMEPDCPAEVCVDEPPEEVEVAGLEEEERDAGGGVGGAVEDRPV